MKKFFMVFAMFSGIILLFSSVYRINNMPVSIVAKRSNVIILDAGHGGEDGGAVAKDGTVEKDINLLFTKNIALYFDLFGIEYIETRKDDSAVGDLSLKTIRERKASDIHRRMHTVNSTPGAILLSIHQNSFVNDNYSGTQVFYADNVDFSAVLADSIQQSVVRLIQPQNTRQVKPTTGSVYLLDKAEKTSVMVECGFLSNPVELGKLKNAEYINQMSYAIFAGLNNYLFSEKGYS